MWAATGLQVGERQAFPRIPGDPDAGQVPAWPLPLPSDRRPAAGHVFGPFGFPLGAGMPPDEVAELTASMRPGDYIDVGWGEIAKLAPTLARGWCGILRGLSWCDGGIVDIFPVRPVLDIEPAVGTAVAVNCFYPHEFHGKDVTGWNRRPLSIVTAASQVRTCQQAELAREHLARLRRETRTLLVEPVPYGKVAGTGFYEQCRDGSRWLSPAETSQFQIRVRGWSR